MTDAASPLPPNDAAPDSAPDSAAHADESVALDGGGPAAELDRIEGIIAQTRSDYRGTDLVEITARLRQRFEQSGIRVDDDALAEYVQQTVRTDG